MAASDKRNAVIITALETLAQLSAVISSDAVFPNTPLIRIAMIGAWASKIPVFQVSANLSASVRSTNIHH